MYYSQLTAVDGAAHEVSPACGERELGGHTGQREGLLHEAQGVHSAVTSYGQSYRTYL